MLIFLTKVLCAAFLLLCFGFVIFWRKNIGAMLMKALSWASFRNI